MTLALYIDTGQSPTGLPKNSTERYVNIHIDTIFRDKWRGLSGEMKDPSNSILHFADVEV